MITGGCQCGAVRYRIERLDGALVCHCRMCQKATGSLFAPLVVAHGVTWQGDERGLFASSNVSNRGFCKTCGTPISLETDDQFEMMIGTLDDPSLAPPTQQANPNDRLACFAQLSTLPNSSPEQTAENIAWNDKVVSYQHPYNEREDAG